MPVYVFPDPRAGVAAILTAAKPTRWPTATISTSFPNASLMVPHIQHAWDGTPTQQANRQLASIRISVWTPKGKVSDGIALAQLVRAVLLDSGSSTVWRFTPAAGPSHGIDPQGGLPFCTFLVTAETRATAVV